MLIIGVNDGDFSHQCLPCEDKYVTFFYGRRSWQVELWLCQHNYCMQSGLHLETYNNGTVKK
jgi:hypothetical protein